MPIINRGPVVSYRMMLSQICDNCTHFPPPLHHPKPSPSLESKGSTVNAQGFSLEQLGLSEVRRRTSDRIGSLSFKYLRLFPQNRWESHLSMFFAYSYGAP